MIEEQLAKEEPVAAGGGAAWEPRRESAYRGSGRPPCWLATPASGVATKEAPEGREKGSLCERGGCFLGVLVAPEVLSRGGQRFASAGWRSVCGGERPPSWLRIKLYGCTHLYVELCSRSIDSVGQAAL
eukprot:COSAG05_NODE_359_length_10803_cov_14.909193_3_plen_129_part_00